MFESGNNFQTIVRFRGTTWFGKVLRIYIPTNHAKFCASKTTTFMFDSYNAAHAAAATNHANVAPATKSYAPTSPQLYGSNITKCCSCTYSDTATKPNAALLPPNVKVRHHQMLPRKIETLTSSHAALATKSDTPASPNIAPAIKVTLQHHQKVTLQHHQICWHPPFARATKKVKLEHHHGPTITYKTSIDLSRKITFHILKELNCNAQPSFKWQIRPSDPFLCSMLLG